jgi:hypothetical protein
MYLMLELLGIDVIGWHHLPMPGQWIEVAMNMVIDRFV